MRNYGIIEEIRMKNIVPEWFMKTSVYQINPRTFSAEGTVKAVTKELPVLAELGFGVMYLCPIFKEDASTDKANWSIRQLASETENPKNPYRMDDYFTIDEEYGTMEDLREFVSVAHGLGLRVILDLVYLHIGPNAEILVSHPEFAMRNEDGSVKLTYWRFSFLNYESEGLREYLWCNMTYYVGVIGVDGFRCDVGDDVPLDFWKEGKRRIRAIKPDAIMINEGARADSYEAFDANYGFSWHENVFSVLQGKLPVADFIADYEDKSAKYGGGLVLRDMDNHDTVTDWPYRVEEHFGSDCMEMVLAMNYSVDGVPMVYCGNELADKTRLSMFANRFHPGKFSATDRSVTGEATEKRKRVVTLLNGLKKSNPVLQRGKTEWLAPKGSMVALNRTLEGKTVTFVGNFSDVPGDYAIDASGLVLLSNNAALKNGAVELDKYGYVIIEK